MFITYQIPPVGYSNTNAATDRENKTRNTISIYNNKGSRRGNQPGHVPLDNFTGEEPSVRSLLGTATEHTIMQYQFNIFQGKVKNMY